MLIDNKNKNGSQKFVKVIELLKEYISEGTLNIVTGYFTISALSYFYNNLNSPKEFKLITGKLVTIRKALQH